MTYPRPTIPTIVSTPPTLLEMATLPVSNVQHDSVRSEPASPSDGVHAFAPSRSSITSSPSLDPSDDSDNTLPTTHNDSVLSFSQHKIRGGLILEDDDGDSNSENQASDLDDSGEDETASIRADCYALDTFHDDLVEGDTLQDAWEPEDAESGAFLSSQGHTRINSSSSDLSRRRHSSSYSRRSLYPPVTSTPRPTSLVQIALTLHSTSLTSTSLAVPYALSLISSSTTHTLLLPPLFLVLVASISGASHVVLAYLARYLDIKAGRVEDLTKGIPGCGGKLAKMVVRAGVVLAGIGLMSMHLTLMVDTLLPLTILYLPQLLQSPLVWTSILGFSTLVLLLLFSSTSKHSAMISRWSNYLCLLLLIPLFIIILTHAVRISKKLEPLPALSSSLPAGRTEFGRILGGAADRPGSFWGGVAILTIALSSHLLTLPSHANLVKSSQPSFPLVPLASTIMHLVFLLPFSLVPYYLLTPFLVSSLPPNILSIIPPSSPTSIIVARVSTILLTATSIPPVFLVTKETVLRGFQALDIHLTASSPYFSRSGARVPTSTSRQPPFRHHLHRRRNGPRHVPSTSFFSPNLLLTLFVFLLVLLPCFFSITVAFLLPAVACLVILLTFFLPSLLFILLFHLRRPFSIIFPPTSRSPSFPTTSSTSSFGPSSSSRADDSSYLPPPSTPLPPSTPRFTPLAEGVEALPSDALLAAKERQLQKRRTGRRVWQDGVVFLGTLPVGGSVVVWTFGRAFGAW